MRYNIHDTCEQDVMALCGTPPPQPYTRAWTVFEGERPIAIGGYIETNHVALVCSEIAADVGVAPLIFYRISCVLIECMIRCATLPLVAFGTIAPSRYLALLGFSYQGVHSDGLHGVYVL